MTRDEKWANRLMMAGSHERAGVLVEALKQTPDPAVKAELLAGHFNICDALAPQREELREQFELADYVTDTPDVKLALPVTVYRGAWSDDEAELALSWTLDRAVAEQFCRIMSGPRGWFLGIARDDVEAYVWKGWCTSAYGFLNGRDENEVIVAEVIGVEPISALRTVPREAAG